MVRIVTKAMPTNAKVTTTMQIWTMTGISSSLPGCAASLLFFSFVPARGLGVRCLDRFPSGLTRRQPALRNAPGRLPRYALTTVDYFRFELRLRLELARFRVDLDFDFGGTFAPFSRASESPIAMACLRLLTFLPLLLFNVPRLRRRMALLTVFFAPLP
jgi:hypothetical protein